MILLAGIWSAVPAHAAPTCTALIIWDQNGAQTQALQSALATAGADVTLTSVPENQYTGTNPAPTDFSEVIHLDGGTQLVDMPASGQSALVQYVRDGGYYVGGEWSAYEYLNGRMQNMRDLILFDRQNGRSGTTTATVTAPSDGLFAGVPATFDVQAGWNEGGLHSFSPQPATTLMTIAGGNPALARRDLGFGTVLGFALSLGSYPTSQPFPLLTNTSIQQIFQNTLTTACALKARITSRPPLAASSPNADFSFTATDPHATFVCRLDNSVESACASPKTYEGLLDGLHSFFVTAIDPVSGARSKTVSYSWRIDSTLPDTVITSGPPEFTRATPVFRFTSNESNARFTCALDAAAFSTCSSPLTLSVPEGLHTFRVIAIDQAGNADTTPASHSFTYDVTAPETSIVTRPAAFSNQASAGFSFQASEIGTYQCTLDGVARACADTQSFDVAEGDHSLRVAAVDRAGNVDPSPAMYSWNVDLTPPQTTMSIHPYATTGSPDAVFTFGATENATFTCALDGAVATMCASPVQFQDLPEGAHRFEVIAIDRAGNADPSPAVWQWAIDLQAPAVTITAPVEGYIYVGETTTARPPLNLAYLIAPGTYHITAGVTDVTAVTVVVSVDGKKLCTLTVAPFSCAWTPAEFSGLHHIEVAATDAARHTTKETVDANVI